ncbi:hypothetical protein WN943_022130 [Citrus x changshan-huyou]
MAKARNTWGERAQVSESSPAPLGHEFLIRALLVLELDVYDAFAISVGLECLLGCLLFAANSLCFLGMLSCGR